MEYSKIIIFLVHGKPVEEINGDDLSLKGVEDMKCAIAFMHGISFDDVEMETKTIPLRDMTLLAAINDSGKLVFKSKHPRSCWRVVETVGAIQNFQVGDGFYDFLDHITNGDIDAAINFN